MLSLAKKYYQHTEKGNHELWQYAIMFEGFTGLFWPITNEHIIHPDTGSITLEHKKSSWDIVSMTIC